MWPSGDFVGVSEGLYASAVVSVNRDLLTWVCKGKVRLG